MELKDVIEALAQPDFRIDQIDLGEHDGWEYRLTGPTTLIPCNQLEQMRRDGWLEQTRSGYVLSDRGRAAYIRSTDELQDGVLRSPNGSERS